MLNLFIGIVIGAAFSPFWMKLWNYVKGLFASKTAKSDTSVIVTSDTPTTVTPVVTPVTTDTTKVD